MTLTFYCRLSSSFPREKLVETVSLLPSRVILSTFSPSGVKKLLGRTFEELTLKDTMKSILIPCYDLCSKVLFLFSHADALEMDYSDFKMKDVCYVTSADPTVVGAVKVRSVDERTKILAVEGGVAMNNPRGGDNTRAE
ncbi:hypothetical protein F3Y22_tig00005459pilonHSYRG00218 [Hibiscus syriacus]|uniref:PNPLA domain-containing protein n=1 Tax=Hibiscus syriacus TaxID=106335 RepID=A0A6A3CKB1_HIBSY|nr:hypothetical protein F3Y22_tig00005459pilonHSYRG00218 [Hibiscus syriacus]